MTGAYSDSGVDTSASARAIDALIGVLRTIDLGRPSRSRLAAGHYAAGQYAPPASARNNSAGRLPLSKIGVLG